MTQVADESCCDCKAAFFSVKRFGMHVCLFCNQQVLATGSSLLDPVEVEARFRLLADAGNSSPNNKIGSDAVESRKEH